MVVEAEYPKVKLPYGGLVLNPLGDEPPLSPKNPMVADG